MTETGKKQAELLGDYLASANIDQVISSDLARAVETAQAIARHHGLTVQPTPLAREWNCGTWDGKPITEFLEMLKTSGLPVSALDPPGGEKLSDVKRRACSFINDLKDKHMGRTVVVCSHGDYMRMMMSCMLEIEMDQANALRFDNASYSIAEYDGVEWRLLAMSCLPMACV